MALVRACRADVPPDTSRWYVEVPFERVVRAVMAMYSPDSFAPIAALGEHANYPARVYFDGSGYVEIGYGQQGYFAQHGGLWDAGDTAAWQRFKALVGREGMGD